MSHLLSLKSVSKVMGSKVLFEDLSFGIQDREKLGLLGPNGSGKSSLLKIMAGKEIPDNGEVSRKRALRWAYVAQEENFSESTTLMNCATQSLVRSGMEESEAQIQGPIYLGRVGFEDFDQPLSQLSGGWRKRLALAIAMAQEPELLILDEPTNHMDWQGIFWLENWLKNYSGAMVLVSHDRSFLNHTCQKMMEVNRLYEKGALSFSGGYEEFVKKKQEYIQAQLARESSMSNKARREVEWLRAGVKARTTKSQSRIKEAHELLEDLAEIKSRNRAAQNQMRVEIDSSGKKSKKLIELKKISIGYDETDLVKDLTLIMGPGQCLGLLGDNGSGKTSLLKALSGQLPPRSGEVFLAEGLKVVYFDQKREDLPLDQDLVEYLGDGSDYTLFKDQSIHVASYASRFRFDSDRLKLKISQLSGGERARLLIAKLLLQPADVLILDEPTNDLDIESIEILEEQLKAFEGLVLLVSHDRSFLSGLCDRFLALDGLGGWTLYADLNQWLKQRKKSQVKSEKQSSSSTPIPSPPKRVRLSYKEKRAMETMEADLEQAEGELAQAQEALSSSEVYQDKVKMEQALARAKQCQDKVDQLYELWAEIEEKLKGGE